MNWKCICGREYTFILLCWFTKLVKYCPCGKRTVIAEGKIVG